MASTKTLIGANTQGLFLLTQQRFDEAARTFRGCLQELHELLQIQAADEAANKTPTPKTLFYEAVPADVNEETPSRSMETSPMLPYNKGFMVIFTGEEDREDAKIPDEHLFSAVFLYNLSLTFLLRGVARPDSRHVDYKRSIALFNMSVNFFPGMPRNAGGSSLLRLAVYNNLAHIHSQIYNIAAFESSLEVLKDLVCECQVENEEDHDFFALNVVVSDSFSSFRLAPAA